MKELLKTGMPKAARASEMGSKKKIKTTEKNSVANFATIPVCSGSSSSSSSVGTVVDVAGDIFFSTAGSN